MKPVGSSRVRTRWEWRINIGGGGQAGQLSSECGSGGERRVDRRAGGRALYLPERWTADWKRCQAAGVPEEVTFATKPELALEILRQARRDGVPPAPVLGDSAYGNNAEFRAGVRDLGLEFFLQVDGQALKGWDREVRTEVKRVRRYVCAGNLPPRPWRS